jgi:dihydrofolate reductase
MRNVVYGINISIDGACEHTNFMPDAELMDFFTDQMSDVDLMVYGRKTYELMVPYWPEVAKTMSGNKEDNAFAQRFSAIDKVVFSKTLHRVDGNARIERGNLEEEILKLKQQAGKKISVGGVNLPAQLMALGLIDEYYFVIHPLIVGEGRRLTEDDGLAEKLNLKLVKSKIFKSGVVVLHYEKQ